MRVWVVIRKDVEFINSGMITRTQVGTAVFGVYASEYDARRICDEKNAAAVGARRYYVDWAEMVECLES